MSLSAIQKNPKHEMAAGVHLALIHSIKRYTDSEKNLIVRDGEAGVVITFINGQGQFHEQVYWIGKGQDGREKYFTRMCIDAGIDMSKAPLSAKDAKNKRVWIAIKEIYTLIKNGEELKKDMFDNPVKEYFVFQTSLVYDADRIPTWKGDPAKNGGEAKDDFVGYRTEEETGYDTITTETETVVPAGPVLEIKSSTPEVEAGLEKSLDEVKNNSNAVKQVEDKSLTGTPALNFDEEPPLTHEQEYDIHETDKMLHEGRQEATDTMDTVEDDRPNFGDNTNTPDLNF